MEFLQSTQAQQDDAGMFDVLENTSRKMFPVALQFNGIMNDA